MTLLWALAGCSTPGLDSLRSESPGPQRPEATPPATPSGTARPKTRPYRIQAGDLLEVRFFFNPELDQPVRVQPDGAITLPFLGTRTVAGMEIPEVSGMVREVFAAELQQPQVTIQLIEAAERRVYVGGAVNGPREIDFRPGLTPLEAVLAAGGFASDAEADALVVVRKDAAGRPVPTQVDLRDMTDASTVLEPWDIVIVRGEGKESEWVGRYLRGL